MGYRSEIGVLITVPVRVNSDKLIGKIAHIWGDDFNDCFSVKKFKENGIHFIALHCDWIKWYESYTCVRKFMNFIASWENHYKTGGVSYIRIGEDECDVDDQCYGEPSKYIELVRYMEVDGLESWQL